MEKITVEKEIGGKVIKLETGKIAKQAHGTVIASCGETMVMCVVVEGAAREGIDFFPLMCEYREAYASAGKIPGSFLRREARLNNRETLVSRMIDRPIRPNFPKGYRAEVQINCQVLSYDPENDPAVLAMIGASAALGISHIPFQSNLGAVKVGYVDGQLVANPSNSDMEKSDLDLLVSGSSDSIMMVESCANEISEELALDALSFAQDIITQICSLNEELISKAGVEKVPFESPENNNPYFDRIKECKEGLIDAFRVKDKKERNKTVSEFKEVTKEKLLADVSEDDMSQASSDFADAFDHLKTEAMRDIIFSGKRCDGRGLSEVRPIDIETGFLPRSHGSALFTRGETQAIVTSTLGNSKDSLLIDGLEEKSFDSFMLHYNFPKYCVGEAGPNRGAGRREIGHGNLAQRALSAVLPEHDDFPYTLRIVSDITESNGSSSMASVCGGSLSLMDAGVPISGAVAGIAMGLCQDGDKEAVLSDILGDEDHYGDMDFKVAGTEKGITALQMDIKIQGLSKETLKNALTQAKEGRLHILGEMAKAISKPKEDLSPYAPRIVSIKIDPEFIGKVIGPGGSMIREIQAESGTELEIEDDGTVKIFSNDKVSTDKAIEMIEGLTSVPEVGKAYPGVVKGVKDFGAFVEFLPGTQGLLHISEISDDYVKDINTVIALNDEVRVVVSAIDKQGKVKLVREEKYLRKNEDKS